MNQTTVNSRIIRSGVYIEPRLYDIAQKVAEEKGQSYSTWARRVIFDYLVAQGRLSQEDVLQLASA